MRCSPAALSSVHARCGLTREDRDERLSDASLVLASATGVEPELNGHQDLLAIEPADVYGRG